MREVARKRKRHPLSDLDTIFEIGRCVQNNYGIYADLGDDRFTGLGVAGVKFCPSPLTLVVVLTTLAATCECVMTS